MVNHPDLYSAQQFFSRCPLYVSFDDVLLVPHYSDIESRKSLSTKNSLGNVPLDLPIISSPMDTVTEVAMASAMDAHGGLGIIHRYNSIQDQAALVKDSKEKGLKNSLPEALKASPPPGQVNEIKESFLIFASGSGKVFIVHLL